MIEIHVQWNQIRNDFWIDDQITYKFTNKNKWDDPDVDKNKGDSYDTSLEFYKMLPLGVEKFCPNYA